MICENVHASVKRHSAERRVVTNEVSRSRLMESLHCLSSTLSVRSSMMCTSRAAVVLLAMAA
jgi:hypothetical protein